MGYRIAVGSRGSFGIVRCKYRFTGWQVLKASLEKVWGLLSIFVLHRLEASPFADEIQPLMEKPLRAHWNEC
jgi:hypothetical protein